MLEGEYIKNNTRFCKPPRKIGNSLFVQNVVFIYSDSLELDMQNLLVEEEINTIRLTDDYQLDNLDFLNNYNLPFIRRIDILSDSVKNIDGIYNLKNLEDINSINQKIDYTRFSKLRSIIGELNTFSYKSLPKLSSLEFLAISDKFREEDLTVLSKNIKLKYLMLRGSKITSLKGLENFKELETLKLFHNKKLTCLEGITEAHISLKKIIVYVAPKLFYVNDYLALLTWLEYLELQAKKVDSYRFLDNLKQLSLLVIHNKINTSADGDEEPLLNALKRTNGKIW